MTVKASDITVTIQADDTAFKEEIVAILKGEIAKLLKADIGARVEYSILKGQTPKPGMLPPLSHTYAKDGRTVVEVDAIYVVGQGYVYI